MTASRTDGMLDENCGISVRPLWIRIRKGFPDITQSGGAENGIGDRMKQNVRIAVTVEPEFIVNPHTTQNERTVSHQPVTVMPQANSHVGRPHLVLLP
jgi:hypothetical protein